MKSEPNLLQIITKGAKVYADVPAQVRAAVRRILRRLKAGPTLLADPSDEIGECTMMMGLALQTMLRWGLVEVGEKRESGCIYRLPTPYHQILSNEAIAHCRNHFLEKEERPWWPKVVEYLASGEKSLSSICLRVYGTPLPQSCAVGLLVSRKVLRRVACSPLGLVHPSWSDTVIFQLNPAALHPQHHSSYEHPYMPAAEISSDAAPEIEEGDPFPQEENEPIDADEPEPPPESEEIEPGPPVDDADYDPETCDPEDRPNYNYELHQALCQWAGVGSEDYNHEYDYTSDTHLDSDDDRACFAASDHFTDLIIRHAMRDASR